MELLDVLKVFGGAIGGTIMTAIVGRYLKGTDDIVALKVEIAILKERVEAYAQKLTTVDNRAAAAFAKIDKVRSKIRDSGKDDADIV